MKRVEILFKKYEVLGNQNTQSVFGVGLLEAGQKNSQVVALYVDVMCSLEMNAFFKWTQPKPTPKGEFLKFSLWGL